MTHRYPRVALRHALLQVVNGVCLALAMGLFLGCGRLGFELQPEIDRSASGAVGVQPPSEDSMDADGVRNADAGALDGSVASEGGTASPVRAKLLSHWQFEGDALDTVGGFHGEALDGVTFVPGVIGQAIALGSADLDRHAHVRVASDAPDEQTPGTLNPDSVSLSFWMKPEASTADGWVVQRGRPCMNHYGCRATAERVSCWFHTGLEWCGSDKMDAPIEANAWTHVAFTVDRSVDRTQVRLRLYVDGNLASSRDLSGSFPNDTADQTRYLVMGRNYREKEGEPVQSGFTGLIDEVRIYSGVLSANEVAALSNR